MKIKLLYKTILICMTVVVMQTNYCSAGCASDDMHIPPPDLSKMDLMQDKQAPPKVSNRLPDEPLPPPKSLIEEKVAPEKESKVAEESKQVAQESANLEKPEPVIPKKSNGFVGVLVKMFSALVKVILLLTVIYAGILLYRRLKEMQLLPLKKKEETSQKVTSGEPETVSEAVSSFVKHRIKKNS